MEQKKSISFPFLVQKTFIERNWITIPKRYHRQLEEESFVNLSGEGHKTSITVDCERHHRVLEGHIYYGIAGYGPYYQIRINHNYPTDYFGYLKRMDKISVKIEKKLNGVQITLD